MTTFASMIYKMKLFIHAAVRAFALLCVVSHSPEPPRAIPLCFGRPQPTRSLLNAQLLHPGQNWRFRQDNVSRRGVSSVTTAISLAFYFFQYFKKPTQKERMSVSVWNTMRDLFSSIIPFKSVQENTSPVWESVVVQRHALIPNSLLYSKLISIKYDMRLLERALWKSCARPRLCKSHSKDDQRRDCD